MSTASPASRANDRLARLGRQAAAWRNVAIATSLLLGATAVTAFRVRASARLEGESVTLRGPRGAAVTLSLTTQGDLQARFAPGEPRMSSAGPSLIIVDQNGRTVARLGAPSARNVAP